MKHKKHRTVKRQGETLAQAMRREQLFRKACEKEISAQTVRIEADRRLQVAAWMQAVALHETFGFGATRIQRFLVAMQEVADEVTRMTDEADGEYALEKLRQRAEQVSGLKIDYIHR